MSFVVTPVISKASSEGARLQVAQQLHYGAGPAGVCHSSLQQQRSTMRYCRAACRPTAAAIPGPRRTLGLLPGTRMLLGMLKQ